MINKLSTAWLLVISIIMHCSTSGVMLSHPEADRSLLIGSLSLDINGYQNTFALIQGNIEVAIVGRYLENDMVKNFGRWTITDERGYFFLANVPDGEYALKDFRIHLIGIGDLSIVNELNDPQRNYYELLNDDIINFSGNLFDIKSQHRIINLQHNLFTLYPNTVVDHHRFEYLNHVKVSPGNFLDEPPVPVYFLENYSESGWDDYLNMQ